MGNSNLDSITIRVPKDALDLSQESLVLYSAIGFFSHNVASLEFAIDRFIFTYARRKSPLISKMNNFPSKMSEKIDFIVSAYLEYPPLRECGDADGRLDLNGMGFSLEEIWDVRNHLIHGNIVFSDHEGDSFSFLSTKYERLSKNRYQIVKYKIRRITIVRLLDWVSYFKAMILQGQEILEGKDPKKISDEIRKNRASIRDLIRLLKDENTNLDLARDLEKIVGAPS